ncbi:DUF2142 domain-containing protein [Azospirillum sp. B4]|uniref:DUF2142 domain-containing protein n=1 Tax=Azospirillum sp. B4 TaxID=95605 RepID=UPI000344B387|nr:DUF2142 domain-containing protein [Azospirillum sp. B4]
MEKVQALGDGAWRHDRLVWMRALITLGRRPILAATCYSLVALVAVLFIASVLPSFEIPDEVSHFLKAESISEGNIRPVILGDSRGAGVDAGALDYWGAYNEHITKASPVPPGLASAAAAVRWKRETKEIGFSNTAQYGPFFYIPQAATLAIGRLFDFSVEVSYRAARLAGALTAVLVAAAAIALARWGRLLLAVMLLTPMYLFLTVSVSQDGLLIAVSALYAALLTRLWSRDAGTGWLTSNRTFLMALACVLMLSLARLPYVLLSILLVHPDRLDIRSLWRQRRFFAGFATPLLAPVIGFAFVLWWALWAHIPGTKVIIDSAIDPSAQMGLLMSHPWRILLVAFRSWHNLTSTGIQIIGVLGWLNIVLSPSAYNLGQLAIYLAIVVSMLQRSGPALKAALVTWIVLWAVTGAIVMALYVTWTPVGAPSALGLQGRYFMPLICVGILALPTVRAHIFASSLGRRMDASSPGALEAGIGSVQAIMSLVATTGMVVVLLHALGTLQKAYIGS